MVMRHPEPVSGTGSDYTFVQISTTVWFKYRHILVTTGLNQHSLKIRVLRTYVRNHSAYSTPGTDGGSDEKEPNSFWSFCRFKEKLKTISNQTYRQRAREVAEDVDEIRTRDAHTETTVGIHTCKQELSSTEVFFANHWTWFLFIFRDTMRLRIVFFLLHNVGVNLFWWI